LEARSGCRLHIDSESGEVSIDDTKAFEPILTLKVRDAVRAIGRGFSPEHALRLFSDDCYFELLDFHDYVGKHKGHIRRVTARLIGSEGKTRRIIEEQTQCDLAIYGHTVGIIGDLEDLANAKQAVDMILRGAEHASVYRFLENQRRRIKRESRELW
ncbi:MAG: ribosomal assembly protein, partial [Thermoplasmata archaeon]|nr:ribosomal assembly protein [Thermoplasmata archaeon]